VEIIGMDAFVLLAGDDPMEADQSRQVGRACRQCFTSA
jgi:hypothetical protein